MGTALAGNCNVKPLTLWNTPLIQSLNAIQSFPSGEGTGEGKTATPDLTNQGCVDGALHWLKIEM